ncbi:hypothetical protein F8S13_02005 [Chloroflexia bacterium SDU3-3]|nr:hypothetical protein F8S13_02005 [Chloroflexia bacterium SDU3-3]
MNPHQLSYTFVCFAAHIDASWGHGTPAIGARRIADLASVYGIPVTWIVNSGSITELQPMIQARHERWGDSVILCTPPHLHSNDTAMISAALREAICREWELLTSAFPWVEAKVAAAGYITPDLVRVLDELAFDGLWGYCWEQSRWDNISHQGCPWGMWYIDPLRYKVPNPSSGGMVACEWTARDLHAAYHTGQPCIYSTDPNDVLRAGLCSATSDRYWRDLFGQYMRNTQHNQQVIFVQHQEAHEMERSDRFAIWSQQEIDDSARLLGQFFHHVRSSGATCTSLPDAVARYRQAHSATAPALMLCQGSDVVPQINSYTMAHGGVSSGPWPETLLYYDAECQMAFVRGSATPHMLRSYVGAASMEGNFRVANLPEITIKHYTRSAGRIDIQFTIGHSSPMPFGLAYWDDLRSYQITDIQGVHEATIVEHKVVFMRLTLTGLPQIIHLQLHADQANPSLDASSAPAELAYALFSTTGIGS